MLNVRESATFKEMCETPGIIRNFQAPSHLTEFFDGAAERHFYGAGSSIRFPGGVLHHQLRQDNADLGFNLVTGQAGAMLSTPLRLRKNSAVVLLSNSGNTNETITLGSQIKDMAKIFAVTAKGDSTLSLLCGATNSVTLSCGAENAIAATKSVMEQALVLHSTLPGNYAIHEEDRLQMADTIEHILTQMDVSTGIADILRQSERLHISGPDDGVADELVLKFSETCLPATPHIATEIVHGPQETMAVSETAILFNPRAEDEEKIYDTLVRGAGMKVIAIATRDTMFTTLVLPDGSDGAKISPYCYLAAGWRLLIETAEVKGVDLDKPNRAQKIGYEYTI